MKIKKEDKNRCLRFNKRHETKVSISYSRSHWHATLFLLINQLEIVFFFFIFFILMAKLFDRFFSREWKPQSHETIVTIIFSTKKTLKFFFPRRTILFTLCLFIHLLNFLFTVSFFLSMSICQWKKFFRIFLYWTTLKKVFI